MSNTPSLFAVSNKSHILYLDSIRGLAALTVITEHYVIAYGLPCENKFCQQILDYSPLNFWWDGGAAVSMFFVLSGLVLSLKYFRLGHKPDLAHFDLVGFTVGRLFRIWLPYWIVLLVSAGFYLQTADTPIIKTLLPPSEWLTEMWHANPLSAFAILQEGFLLKMPSTIVLLPQAWTLTIELVLSLLLPVGLLIVERGTGWLIFFGLFAVSCLGVSSFLLHFILGLLAARYYSLLASYMSNHRWQRYLTLLIGIFFYTSGSIFQDLKLNETLIWLGSGLGAGLILLFVFGSSRTQMMLSHPILRQLGKVSYSAYLLHMLVLLCLTPAVLNRLELITTNRFLLWLSGYFITLIIVQFLSLISYSVLEIPSISLGRQAANRIRSIG